MSRGGQRLAPSRRPPHPTDGLDDLIADEATGIREHAVDVGISDEVSAA